MQGLSTKATNIGPRGTLMIPQYGMQMLCGYVVQIVNFKMLNRTEMACPSSNGPLSFSKSALHVIFVISLPLHTTQSIFFNRPRAAALYMNPFITCKSLC